MSSQNGLICLSLNVQQLRQIIRKSDRSTSLHAKLKQFKLALKKICNYYYYCYCYYYYYYYYYYY